MSQDEMTTNNVKSDRRGYGFLFHIKLRQLYIILILILLPNLVLNEIIELNKPKFVSFKTNFYYLISDKNHTSHYDQIFWLKNKMCRHLNDSYVPVIKYLDKLMSDRNHAIHYDRINWLKNKMCRQTNDSHDPVIKNLDNYSNKHRMNTYVQNGHLKWLINKGCRQLNNSYLPVIKDIYNWTKYPNYRTKNGNNYSDVYYLSVRSQLKIRINPVSTRKPFDTSISATSHDSIPAATAYTLHIVQINWLKNKLCRHLNDSCQPIKNDCDKYWLSNKGNTPDNYSKLKYVDVRRANPE